MGFFKRLFSVMAPLTYLGLGVAAVGGTWLIMRPTSSDDLKNFGVLATIELTAVGTVVGMLVSFFTLKAQFDASNDLEEKKGEIIKGIEDQKKEILKEITLMQGDIAWQKEFLNHALGAKAVAYEKLSLAANRCYRELQQLAKGQFDPVSAAECERELHDAQALASNLEEEHRKIAEAIVQYVMNIVDAVTKLKNSSADTAQELLGVWNTYAKPFGDSVSKLRQLALFRGVDVRPKPERPRN